MAIFTDEHKQTWEVRINAPIIEAIREEVDPDFLKNETGESNTMDRLAGDLVLLVQVLTVCCRKEREARGLDGTEFAELIFGDTLDGAVMAIRDAVMSFSPKQTREILEASAALSDKARDYGVQKATKALNSEAMLNRAKKEIDQMLEQLLVDPTSPSMPSGSSTSVPASSGSTQES